jgi:hypothetical protein
LVPANGEKFADRIPQQAIVFAGKTPSESQAIRPEIAKFPVNSVRTGKEEQRQVCS